MTPPQAAPQAPTQGARGLRGRAHELFLRAKNENASPPQVGLSIAIGVFAGCTPFLGLHMWIALGLATVFRLNRLLAFIGSRISFMPMYLWISFCEIELGHRLRTGAWVSIVLRDTLARGHELIADWLVGAAGVGAALAAPLGFTAYRLAKVWARRQAAEDPFRLPSVIQRRPDEPHRPTSESPP